jgi:hypothetical protein
MTSMVGIIFIASYANFLFTANRAATGHPPAARQPCLVTTAPARRPVGGLKKIVIAGRKCHDAGHCQQLPEEVQDGP